MIADCRIFSLVSGDGLNLCPNPRLFPRAAIRIFSRVSGERANVFLKRLCLFPRLARLIASLCAADSVLPMRYLLPFISCRSASISSGETFRPRPFFIMS